MLKRTLHFSNPAHLSMRNRQLIIERKENEPSTTSIPIEDIGLVILEHPHITITMAALQELTDEKAAVITCNSKYMPSAMFLPYASNTEQTERFRQQIAISEPLKKQLWKQTVQNKIENQARVLEKLSLPCERLIHLVEKVKSGDTTNCEGQAAAYYWKTLYGTDFFRSQEKASPNAQLNYGYAILRSIVARALSSTGLHPSLGIFHRNKYNAFCLADDIMEPYRPLVDWEVIQLLHQQPSDELTRDQKIALLKLPQLDTTIQDITRPLFHAVSITTAGLYKCITGEQRKIPYPILPHVERPF